MVNTNLEFMQPQADPISVIQTGVCGYSRNFDFPVTARPVKMPCQMVTVLVHIEVCMSSGRRILSPSQIAVTLHVDTTEESSVIW